VFIPQYDLSFLGTSCYIQNKSATGQITLIKVGCITQLGMTLQVYIACVFSIFISLPEEHVYGAVS
jgi:hypothetical protein